MRTIARQRFRRKECCVHDVQQMHGTNLIDLTFIKCVNQNVERERERERKYIYAEDKKSC